MSMGPWPSKQSLKADVTNLTIQMSTHLDHRKTRNTPNTSLKRDADISWHTTSAQSPSFTE